MLDGILIKPLKRHIDDRGFFTELMRLDWKEILGDENFVQVNFSMSYPGIIRAWHRHLRGQIDYFMVLKGALKLCVYDEKTQELDEIVSSELELKIVRVPGHYWHGFQVVSNEPALLVYFANRLYDYENPDEERRSWNDAEIIPKLVNGNVNDPRVSKSWDWNYPPYR